VKIPASLMLCVFLIATALSGCSESHVAYPARNMPDDLMSNAAQRQAGHDLFMSKCARCHGKPSEGLSERAAFFDPPAPDFTNPQYQQVDPAYLFWRIEVGKTVEPYLSSGSVMPSWRGLADEEIWQLVAYLKIRAE
jgi:mono/diheme cytochrome c family protein